MKYYEKLQLKKEVRAQISKYLKHIQVLDSKLETLELFAICGSTPEKRKKYELLYQDTYKLIVAYRHKIKQLNQRLDEL